MALRNPQILAYILRWPGNPGNATTKSRKAFFPRQRLNAASFSFRMLCGLAGMPLCKKRTDAAEKDQVQPSRLKTVVILYLKKNAGRVGVRAVFRAPNKLGAMCRQMNSCEHRTVCSRKHVTSFVECQRNVIYEIPLTCGLVYAGQTGRCLNGRLIED